MKTSLFINREDYVRHLVKLAAFTLLATPAFAQTYTSPRLKRNPNSSRLS